MTYSTQTKTRGVIAAAFGLFLAPAIASAGEPNSVFDSADIDLSGDLTYAEFTSIWPKKVPAKALEKRFHRADKNDNNLVTRAEWIAFRDDDDDDDDDLKERKKWRTAFIKADTDADDLLTYEEFITANPGKNALIQVRKRFLQADRNDDGFVSLNEFFDLRDDDDDDDDDLRISKFDLADLDGDGTLTPDEFDTLYPRKTPARPILKKFNKLDKDDDGAVSLAEWRRNKKNDDRDDDRDDD